MMKDCHFGMLGGINPNMPSLGFSAYHFTKKSIRNIKSYRFFADFMLDTLAILWFKGLFGVGWWSNKGGSVGKRKFPKLGAIEAEPFARSRMLKSLRSSHDCCKRGEVA